MKTSHKNLTPRAVETLRLADEFRKEADHSYIGTEHLLIGLILNQGVAASLLAEKGVTENSLREKVGLPLKDGTTTTTDRNVESVRQKLEQRSEVGQRKYGVTTDKANLTRLQWLRHLQEELLNASVYTEELIQEELSMSETLLLGIALMQRFRCKKVAKKPDAHSWSVEQDFISGVQTALELSGRRLPEIITRCQESKRSITTLTVSDFST